MAENPFGSSTEVAVAATTGLVSVEQQRAIAEIQARMIMARANPRDPRRAMDQILQDCTRVSLAESALYQYARGGTDISGPSIRLAESIARRWGNIHAGIRELDRRDGFSECSAFCWDLETGYFEERQFRVRHWRDTKGGGYRVTDERDIYELIANQAQRRKRAVVLSVIPGDVVEEAVQQCEETLHTKADTSPEAVKKMADSFAALGVTKEQIEALCQRRLEAIRPAQIVRLRRIYASLKDEMSVASDWFEPSTGTAAATNLRGNAALRSRLQTGPPPEPPEDDPEEPEDEQEEDDSPAPDDPAQPPAAVPAATLAVGVTPPAATRRRRRGKLEEPTEAEIERSQDAIAMALGAEELAKLDAETMPFEPDPDDNLEPLPPYDPDPSVFVPFDATSNVQEWFGRARTQLREMQEARLTPDRFRAFRKANFGALMRLSKEFASYSDQLDSIITAGERGGAALGYSR